MANTLMELVLHNVRVGGDFGYVAFLAYFMNDQVNRILFEIKEEYAETPHYADNELLKQIIEVVNRATKHFNAVSKGNEYEVADRLVKLEEYFLPHIDAIHQVLEKELEQLGYSADEEVFYSKIFLMMFLARASSMLVNKFHMLTNKFRLTKVLLMKQDDLNMVFELCVRMLETKMGTEHVGQISNHSKALKEVFQNFSMRFQNKVYLGELMK